MPLIGGILVAAALTTCGGGDGGGGSSLFAPSATGSSDAGSYAGTSTTTLGRLTLAQQIEQLERKGGYPTLDRSDDIAGPDTNKNGVRDDIEAWINTLNVTEPQRKALMQDARATQRALLVDLTDKAAVQRVGEGLMASNHCGAIRFKPFAEFIGPSQKIEAMTANTRERAARYMQYNKARSGSSTTLPNYDTCEP
ncbi:MAG TPA: hypothetical protein VGH84_17645 [Steroidobacteraceae bacterium]